jgi:hypothetical protein
MSESLTLRAVRAERYPSLKSTSKRPGCDGTYTSVADMEDKINKKDQEHWSKMQNAKIGHLAMSRDDRGQ